MEYNNVVVFLSQLACKKFGGNDGVFNSAGFAQIVEELTGLPITEIDGEIVRLILSNRSEISSLPGGSHWKVII
jgi:hypothetical protein